MRRNLFFAIFLSLSLLISDRVLAEKTKPKHLDGIEFLSGFGWNKLHKKGNYHLTPFIVDLDFNLSSFLQKLNLKQPLYFQMEPFISFVSEPKSNIETGTSFFLKLGFLPQTAKLQPYIKVGLGVDYMTLHIREQATQFNFTEQGCLGMHYFFSKNTAFTLESRFRHLSNASIKYPNHGINTSFVVAGISYQF